MGGGGAAEKMKKVARKLFVQAWGSLCRKDQHNMVIGNSAATVSPVCRELPNFSALENQTRSVTCQKIPSEITERVVSNSSPPSDKNLCAICLDPLNYSSGRSASQPIFTAQCSHTFHFTCISSNVRHGSVTCPICRAHWTQLPRTSNTRCLLHNKRDPALQILDDSIASLRVHRDALLSSARYNDDDPIVPDHASGQSRLHLSLYPNFSSCSPQAPRSVSCPRGEILSEHLAGSSSTECSPSNRAYLRVKLLHQPAIDLVLVASPSGPHLRLMKQAMALTVFSLRPMDRLAIITYSSDTARAFPLRRMTSYGKRTALQIIDHLFYMGQADLTDGLCKGVKILGDRLHKNPQSFILHLTDTPLRSHHSFDAEAPVPVHRFHIRSGFNMSNTLFMHEFEEFLTNTLGGGVEDVQLRIGEGRMVVSIGELRGGEERNIPVCIGELGQVNLAYKYRDGDNVRRGEVVVGIGLDKRDVSESRDERLIGARISSVENWGYHDPSMARRWAKQHLHGHRLYT